jgi:tetratricopeptide (TPR) repeat protein
VAIDRERVLVAAQKFVEKKKYDKAVLEYQKIIAEDPNDARTLLKVGDLQSKMEAYADAIGTYERVGKHYASQGFALKAIAVYKQIRELITKHVPQLESQYAHITPKLAELYQQLGLTSDALAALDEVATRLQRQQRDGEAIEVFRKIVELDPTNPLPHLRLAEALSRVQQVDDAVHEFATAASQLLKLGRRDDALKVLERLLHHKPDPAQARIAAELYLARGQQADGMQALAKLQLCFQANPRDLDTLSLLSRAFNVIGQAAKAIEVQKEMARIARDAGKPDVFAQIVQGLLKLAPNDDGVAKMAAAAGLFGGGGPGFGAPYRDAPPPPPVHAAPPLPNPYQGRPGYGPGGPPPGFGPPQPPAGFSPQAGYPPPPPRGLGQPLTAPRLGSSGSYESVDANDLEPSYDQDVQEHLKSMPAEAEIEPVRPTAPQTGPRAAPAHAAYAPADDGQVEIVEEGDQQVDEQVSQQLAQVLADAASFRRVRLYAKAISTLQQGIEIEPRSLDVREALRDVYLEAGRETDAIDEMLAMASLFIDALDGEGAARMLQDVLTVDPQNDRAIEMLRELGYEYVDESEPAPTDLTEAQAEPAVRYDYAQQEAPLPSYDLEEIGPEDVSNEYSDPRVILSPQMTADGPLPSFPLEPPEPEHSTPFDLVQAAAPGDTAIDARPYQEQPAPPSRRVGQADEDGNRPSMQGAELEGALEEAEFFVSRGLFDDARNTLNDQLALHPNNRLLKEKLAEIEQQETSMTRGSGTRERPQSEGPIEEDIKTNVDRSFDIAASLDAVEESQVPVFDHTNKQVDVEEVFAKFKEGVAAQISIDDGQSHYDLGVAYKEMGLVDDAIREFETAARDPKRECICRSMIGMIQSERGNVNEAIDAFMRGLHAHEKSPEQETVLCFEIGNAYETKRMNREALSYFQKVMRRDPNYRDVQERVRRLSQNASKSPPRQAAVGADDEFDRAFDEIIGKA